MYGDMMRTWAFNFSCKFEGDDKCVEHDATKQMISLTMKRNSASRTEPHQGSWVSSPMYKNKASKGNRQNGWVTLGKLLALAC